MARQMSAYTTNQKQIKTINSVPSVLADFFENLTNSVRDRMLIFSGTSLLQNLRLDKEKWQNVLITERYSISSLGETLRAVSNISPFWILTR